MTKEELTKLASSFVDQIAEAVPNTMVAVVLVQPGDPAPMGASSYGLRPMLVEALESTADQLRDRHEGASPKKETVQ